MNGVRCLPLAAAIHLQNMGGVIVSLSWASELVGESTAEFMTHGKYDARPTVTFKVLNHTTSPLYLLDDRSRPTCA